LAWFALESTRTPSRLYTREAIGGPNAKGP
jgi:hypothetical protein